MANPILAELEAEVTNVVTVEAAAVVLINGFAGRVEAAVAKALVNGATAAELAPITAEVAAMRAGSTALSEAIVANTPAAE